MDQAIISTALPVSSNQLTNRRRNKTSEEADLNCCYHNHQMSQMGNHNPILKKNHPLVSHKHAHTS